ncbi:MAG: hypothetical protein BRC48_08370 [Cyanobacteria bacterium QS_9_48_30]|nr:MAG: hypothetical protein BRC48_08370 [Cyanobacteria bacterium QS_9_48_30]
MLKALACVEAVSHLMWIAINRKLKLDKSSFPISSTNWSDFQWASLLSKKQVETVLEIQAEQSYLNFG